MFLDLSLSIRNPYKGVNFSSIEESIKEYLRPEKLEDKFECEQCGEKVFVEKGLCFESLPPILTLQLNRFELNYETMQREKVNSFLYFPEILEMQKFLKPFPEIHISPLPPSLESKTKVTEKEKSARTQNLFGGSTDKPVGEGKKNLKRKNSDDKAVNKEKVSFLDEEMRNQRTKELKGLSVEEEKQRDKDIWAGLKEEKAKMDKRVEKVKPKEDLDLENDMLFGCGGLGTNWNSGSLGKEPTFDKVEVAYEHE